ncbi:hypothetical protein [Metabacillus sp. cB07]|uniref:hypothetical protein n=1 Tax=Metabacillus sp. cB07 TaxID=2806989 RepID=UPI00193A67D8|nr:hypothetical protein [Metabacillus sp. cB07]
MGKFSVRYFFDHELSVKEIVEGENEQSVIEDIPTDGNMMFATGLETYKFNMSDVKLIRVTAVKDSVPTSKNYYSR